MIADTKDAVQRQTIIGQFYQLDKLIVEGGMQVCPIIYQDLHLMAVLTDMRIGARSGRRGWYC